MDTVLLLGLGTLSILRVSKVKEKKQTNAKKRHTLHAQYKELQGTMNMN